MNGKSVLRQGGLYEFTTLLRNHIYYENIDQDEHGKQNIKQTSHRHQQGAIWSSRVCPFSSGVVLYSPGVGDVTNGTGDQANRRQQYQTGNVPVPSKLKFLFSAITGREQNARWE